MTIVAKYHYTYNSVPGHQTATKQGLIQNGSGNKWDDFLVTPP